MQREKLKIGAAGRGDCCSAGIQQKTERKKMTYLLAYLLAICRLSLSGSGLDRRDLASSGFLHNPVQYITIVSSRKMLSGMKIDKFIWRHSTEEVTAEQERSADFFT